MSRHFYLSIYATVAFMVTPQLALAYVGPGTGLSAIGSFFALLMTIVLVVAGFFWLPLKRLLKSRSKKTEDTPAESTTDDSQPQSAERIEGSEDSLTK